MVYRYSWIAGLASIGFAFWQLTRLLLPTASGAKWQLVVLSGFAIGLIVTWTAVTYRLRAIWIVVINVAALFLVATRFAAPSDSLFILPTRSGIVVLWSDLVRAFDVIRHGVEPVRPIVGIVVILTALFWLLGGLLAWGLSKDHPFTALLPPLVVALQFATLNRRNDGLIVLGTFIVLVAGTILAVALDERDRGAGRMVGDRQRPPSNAPTLTAALLVAMTVAVAVVGVGMIGPKLPPDGVLSWRTPGGLGGGIYGGVSYNPYVSIHDGLVSQEGIPLFRATIDGDASPDEVYFRLLTLDTYSNGQWSVNRPRVYALDEEPLEEEGYEFGGETESITADIEIEALGQDWLPTPYAVVGADGEEADAFRIRRTDTSVVFRGDRTYRGMQYRILSEIPVVDPAAVAGVPGGGLSPLFSAAAVGGETPPDLTHVEYRELPDAEKFIDLPPGIHPDIESEAIELTRNLTTSFEKGLAIEHWFRESGGFVYDLDVHGQGHGEDVLATWLFDDAPENVGYRRGYCEQFATSMAVMTRSIGIPTRVVLGFTPGDSISPDEVVVLDNNAHSWVELWIPSQGWVSFDPTPRRDGANPATSYRTMEDALGYDLATYLDQVPEPVRIPADNPNDLPSGVFSQDNRRPDVGFIGTGGETTSASLPGWIQIVSVVAALLVLIAIALPLLKWISRRSRMRRLAEGDVSAAWEEIVVRLTDLAEEPDPASTPGEVAARVDESMAPLAAVYTRSVYGSTDTVPDDQIEVARRSMEKTSERLATRYSPLERTRSQYRLSSLRRRFRR
ncbi:MAG: transglutaminaseTgpA domain-containing protein [Actinomycetota bacterium]|nr:transglutaminaseTgpA domain-containing protein [Actinomycetota bacterium]